MHPEVVVCFIVTPFLMERTVQGGFQLTTFAEEEF